MTRLLHVEDELDIQEVAKMSLELIGGFEVEGAASGAEGVAKAVLLSPDIILLDVMMPGMDGLETLKVLRMKPETCHIPVIFMTAKVQSHELLQYKLIGALGVIHKPFDPVQLPDQVKELLKQTETEVTRSVA